MDTDVLVVGGGPAGLAAAAACVHAGAEVLLIDPDPARPWPNTYGVWVDEVSDLGVPLRRRFAAPVVATAARGVRSLARSYGLVDNDALRADLGRDVPAAAVLAGRVEGLEHASDSTGVHLEDGRRVHARVVVVAAGAPAGAARTTSGAGHPLLEPGPDDPPPAWQTAYGVLARFDTPVVEPGGMVLMDWRVPPGVEPDIAGVPTFLYALDLGDGRTLVEETVLAARPAIAIDRLRERLHARLSATGQPLAVDAAADVERVAIPMGGALPRRPQRAVAFGAAGGLVHPATGYSVTASLRRAGALGRAVAAARREGAGAEEAARAAWEAVWPADLVRQRDLHRYGLESLLRLPPAQVGAFFDAFFDQPSRRWASYLGSAGSARELAGIMLSVARRVPPDARRVLLGGALRPERRWLLAGLGLPAARRRG